MGAEDLTDEEATAAAKAMFELGHAELLRQYGTTPTIGTKEPVVNQRGWAGLSASLQRDWVNRARVGWRAVIMLRTKRINEAET